MSDEPGYAYFLDAEGDVWRFANGEWEFLDGPWRHEGAVPVGNAGATVSIMHDDPGLNLQRMEVKPKD